jgi:hypothetical protein
MFFKWFDTSEVDAMANSLASEFCQRAPKESLSGEARGAKGRLKEATDILMNRVEKFAGGRRLNLYKRARLANTLKWRLLDNGYEKTLVDNLTLEVAKKTSLATKAAK